jgi:hypothetical protein
LRHYVANAYNYRSMGYAVLYGNSMSCGSGGRRDNEQAPR